MENEFPNNIVKSQKPYTWYPSDYFCTKDRSLKDGDENTIVMNYIINDQGHKRILNRLSHNPRLLFIFAVVYTRGTIDMTYAPAKAATEALPIFIFILSCQANEMANICGKCN